MIGNELAVTMAAEAGPLELNLMEPVIAFGRRVKTGEYDKATPNEVNVKLKS